MIKSLAGGILAATAFVMLSSAAHAAGPEIVSGPAAQADCFAPWSADTKFFKYPKKEGPFRIAFANGYIANTWRIQMVQTAKAYAAQPDVKAKIKEFKVVSTGEDVPAQISAINNFIDSGYDAIVTDAQNPTAFGPVIKRAKEAGIVLVAFDNILDTKDAIKFVMEDPGRQMFQQMLFSKIVPNCKKLGLLDAGDGWLRTKFQELGVIQFEDLTDTSDEYESFALGQSELAESTTAIA